MSLKYDKHFDKQKVFGVRNKLELSSAKFSSLIELRLSLAMTVVMQLELILKYFKTAFKDFKVFTGLRLHHLTTSTGGWPGGRVACLKLEIKLSQPQLKLKLS